MPKKTVTIIDDDSADRYLFKKMLEERGFKVSLIDPARGLLKKLARDKSDVILLDMFMGVLNAFDVLQHIDKSKKVFICSGMGKGNMHFIDCGIKGKNIGFIDKNNPEEGLEDLCQII